MDDPISALDANVKKKIFKKVFTGELKDKTRILVTHAVDFLHLVDNIILLKKGEVILQGPYDQIKDDPYLVELMQIHRGHKAEQKDLVDNAPQIEIEHVEEPDAAIPQGGPDLSESLEKSIDDQAQFEHKAKKEKKGKMMSDEADEKISTSLALQLRFFVKYYGVLWIICSQLGMAFFVACRLANDFILG
jgi:ABC-type proline/glycine betaine transport system ATPase subunit